jgi:hypothetical protein
MADVEQERSYAAETGRQKEPCQVSQLAQHRGVEKTLSVPFIVKAYVDGRALTTTAETAKDAFAKAIEWHVVGKLTNVSICDGTRSCSIAEFASVMALVEIAGTIRTNVNPNNLKVSGSSGPRSTSTGAAQP